MRFLPTLALLGAFVLSPTLLSATSIIPFVHLGEAAIYSDAVVLAHATEIIDTDSDGKIYRDARFELLEAAKGPMTPGDVFWLRPLSYESGDFALDIAGDFQPEAGKNYLLFLQQHGAFWRPVMLSYYVFEQLQIGSDEYLVPLGGSGIEAIPRPDGQWVEPLKTYRKNVFMAHLQAFAQLPGSVWNGNTGETVLPQNLAFERAVPTGCDFMLGGSTVLCRWQNAAVPIYYDDSDVPANWATRFSNILSAMNTSYVGLDPSNGGSVDYDPDCADGATGSGSNFRAFCDASLNGTQSTLIMFDDPCDEIAALSNCSGTLAFGGSYRTGSTHVFDGQNWTSARYGYVVVNEGVTSCLTDIQFEQVMTHELTHTYRMDHLDASSYPDNNMNPICCDAINDKDEECMNYAYPAAAPVELMSFEAKLQGAKAVQLQWTTAAERDNAYYSIHRSTDGMTYQALTQVPGGGSGAGKAYTWVDSAPIPGNNYYRLSQTDFDGSVRQLGVRVVTLAGQAGVLRISPNPVSGETLTFSMNFPQTFDGVLEVLSADGRLVSTASLHFEKGPQQGQQALHNLPAGIYALRLSDGMQQWTSRFLKN